MDSIPHQIAIVLVHALQADPALPDRILGIFACVILSCTRVRPTRIDQLGVHPHLKQARRGRVELTQSDRVTGHVNEIRRAAEIQIKPVRGLVNDGVERPADQFQALPGSDVAGLPYTVDSQDEPPIDGQSLILDDRGEKFVGLDDVGLGIRIVLDDLRAEHEPFVEGAELLARAIGLKFIE